MKKEFKIIGGILVGGVILFFLATFFYQQSTTPEQVAGADMSRLVRADSASLGPEDSKVTVVEFLDPECESCRAFHPYVKDILAEFDGRIRFVVRYMLYHGNSRGAAIATEAAGQQGKYWEMQTLLFERQDDWGHQPDPQTEKFVSYAEELGLDTEQFRQALGSEELAQKVDRDHQDGTAIGVRGTPSFYVNEKPLEMLDPYALQSMIAQELDK